VFGCFWKRIYLGIGINQVLRAEDRQKFISDCNPNFITGLKARYVPLQINSPGGNTIIFL
jgi:hypothetical protein